MTRSQVRLGVIGLGVIAQRMLPLFHQHPQVKVAAFCDVNPPLAHQLSAEYGGVPTFTDHRELLSSGLVDLVYVATPPAYHYGIVLDVVKAGKHLLCEKPLAQSSVEAEEMVRAAESAGIMTAINIGMPYRFGVRQFGQQVREGFLGDLRRLDLTLIFPLWPRTWQNTPWVASRAQGGSVREVGPHFIHVIQRFFGPIVRLRAEMEYPADPQACEIGASGVMQLSSGQLVTIQVLHHVPRPETVQLTAYGSKGTMAISNFRDLLKAEGDGLLTLVEEPSAAGGLIPNQALVAELVKGAMGEPADLIPLRSGLAIQYVLDAWERAAETGTWVEVPQV